MHLCDLYRVTVVQFPLHHILSGNFFRARLDRFSPNSTPKKLVWRMHISSEDIFSRVTIYSLVLSFKEKYSILGVLPRVTRKVLTVLFYRKWYFMRRVSQLLMVKLEILRFDLFRCFSHWCWMDTN